MRLHLILPRVEPEKRELPKECPYEDCEGAYFRFHQEVGKALRDTVYPEVKAQRYQCLRCKRTFRVYPTGVTRAHTSLRVKGLAVMLYVLGLSYGAVSLVLEALGAYLCKSQVYQAVQDTAECVPGLKRNAIIDGYRTAALGADVTSVRCNGEWLQLGLSVDPLTGLVLSIDELEGEDAETLKNWLEPIATAVGAEILVSDDADAFKTVADELGLEHQVCKQHVKNNTATLIEELSSAIANNSDRSLAHIGISPEQALQDLHRLGELINSRQPQDVKELEQLVRRYQRASPPKKGERASLAYRLRLLFLDRWNLWGRLTRYRSWHSPQAEQLDGTNNACERGIGWWIKERYRTMRGYKRPQSALNVSRLITFCGNHLDCGGVDLMSLVT